MNPTTILNYAASHTFSWWCPITFWDADCLAHGFFFWLAILVGIPLIIIGLWKKKK